MLLDFAVLINECGFLSWIARGAARLGSHERGKKFVSFHRFSNSHSESNSQETKTCRKTGLRHHRQQAVRVLFQTILCRQSFLFSVAGRWLFRRLFSPLRLTAKWRPVTLPARRKLRKRRRCLPLSPLAWAWSAF